MSAHRKILGKAVLRWIELALTVALVVGVLVLINIIAYRNNARYDLTPEKTYSLAPHTLTILDGLTDELHVTVFFKRKEQDSFLELVELFSRATPRFQYTFIDLDKNPARADALGIKTYGAGIVTYQGRTEKLKYFSENALVSSIIRLTEKEQKLVRFVKGHGEKKIHSEEAQKSYAVIVQAMESENFKVEEILLAQAGRVPDDTLVLVIGGPQKDFIKKELDIIDQYLRRGGRVLWLCDPVRLPATAAFLKRYSIKLTNDFIIDPKSKLMAMDYLTPIVVPDKLHPIAKHMNQATVFPYCRSVLPIQEPGKAMEATVLARSGPDSWAERDYQSVYDGKVVFDADADLSGPVPVGVLTDVAGDEATGQLIVLGDSDFANNHYVTILGNKDFFMNTLNWLAEKSSLLSERPQAAQSPVSMLFLTENESRLVLWTSVVVQPGLVLLLGILVVLWRRVRR